MAGRGRRAEQLRMRLEPGVARQLLPAAASPAGTSPCGTGLRDTRSSPLPSGERFTLVFHCLGDVQRCARAKAVVQQECSYSERFCYLALFLCLGNNPVAAFFRKVIAKEHL